MGVRPVGAVALEERANGQANKRPGVNREDQWRQQAEPGAVGSNRRPIHRAVILSVFAGMGAVLLAWVWAIVWGAAWILRHLPLV